MGCASGNCGKTVYHMSYKQPETVKRALAAAAELEIDPSVSLRTIDVEDQRPDIPNLEIHVKDAPGPGGASSHYLILKPNPQGPGQIGAATLQFQNKPLVNPEDINGITNESLLLVIIDRLKGFLSGPYPDDYTEAALLGLEAALQHLNARTLDRIERGVEGTHQA